MLRHASSPPACGVALSRQAQDDRLPLCWPRIPGLSAQACASCLFQLPVYISKIIWQPPNLDKLAVSGHVNVFGASMLISHADCARCFTESSTGTDRHDKCAAITLHADWHDSKTSLIVQGASASLQMHPYRHGHRARRAASGYMLRMALQILLKCCKPSIAIANKQTVRSTQGCAWNSTSVLYLQCL